MSKESIFIYGNGKEESTAVHHKEDEDVIITIQPSITACKPSVTDYKRQNGIMGLTVNYSRDAIYEGRVEVITKANMFSVEKRFQLLEDTVKLISAGFHTAGVLAGQGGLGKTQTALNAAESFGLTRGEVKVPMTKDQYIKVSGATSPSELYSLLYTQRKEGLIIFDDCDSVFKDETSCNILKAVLDTSEIRNVTWLSPYIESLGLPTNFDFLGRILFISNRTIKKIPQAVISRSMTLDMSFTQSEIIERMSQLAPKLFPNFSETDISDVMSLIDENKDLVSDLNLRTLIKVGRIKESGCENWKDLAIFTA